MASVGMADTGNDFLVVRLIFSTNKREIEILSTNSRHSEWIYKESKLPLELDHKSSCDVVFNGEPYWIAIEHKQNRKLEILVKFDRANMELKTHPIIFKEDGDYNKLLVKLYNNCMLVWNDEPTSNIEGWGFNDNEFWNKLWVVAPPRDIDIILGLSIEGHIIVEYDDRLVFIICQGPHKVLVGSSHIKIQIGERRTNIGEEGSFEILETEKSPLILEGMTTVLDDRS